VTVSAVQQEGGSLRSKRRQTMLTTKLPVWLRRAFYQHKPRQTASNFRVLTWRQQCRRARARGL